MRALWTAASGMTTQQTNIDTISNNLSNLGTIGYKKEAAQFKTLLYQTIQQAQTDSNGDEKPIPAQVGLGVRTSAIKSITTQGVPMQTGNGFDLAIEGDGYFAVRMQDGTIGYTRNGSFQLSVGNGGLTLSNAEGYPVLDSNGEPIVIPEGLDKTALTIDKNGFLCYPDQQNNAQSIGTRIGIVKFSNPAGLLKSGGSILLESAASGQPTFEELGKQGDNSRLLVGYLENSNVEAVEEMVNLIVAQRAYEMNSKVINASDEMLQQANNLRR